MSEYGRGFAYCLGLFLAHEHSMRELRSSGSVGSDKEGEYASLWFNGAAEHLYELQPPECLGSQKLFEIGEFVGQALNWRTDYKCTWKDVASHIQKAKDLLREWDEFLGIPSEKGENE